MGQPGYHAGPSGRPRIYLAYGWQAIFSTISSIAWSAYRSVKGEHVSWERRYKWEWGERRTGSDNLAVEEQMVPIMDCLLWQIVPVRSDACLAQFPNPPSSHQPRFILKSTTQMTDNSPMRCKHLINHPYNRPRHIIRIRQMHKVPSAIRASLIYHLVHEVAGLGIGNGGCGCIVGTRPSGDTGKVGTSASHGWYCARYRRGEVLPHSLE